MATTLTWGSLSANTTEPRSIYDWELQDLIADKIGAGSDILLVNTACFGGDFLENFNSTTGDAAGGGAFDIHGFSNTTVISGNPGGKTTKYGGFHRGAAGALAPGGTAADVKGAPAAAGETPQSTGDLNKTIGGVSSTHILVWAGQPNDDDVDDLVDVVSNFQGNGNTTIHALYGASASATGQGPDGNVTVGPATRAGLEGALTDIGALMAPGEQFVMLITDHGNIEKIKTPDAPVITGGGNINVPIDVPIELIQLQLGDPNNIPKLTLLTDPFQPSQFPFNALEVSLNGNSLGTLANCDWSYQQLLPDGTLQYGFDFHLPAESFFDVFTEIQTVELTNLSQLSSPAINFVVLGSGDIARIPEPSTALLMLIGLAWSAAAQRRTRRRLSN